MTQPQRLPVHVVYGGAHLFRADTAARLGAIALEALRSTAPTPAALARVLEYPTARARELHRRVAAKLRTEPVEDYRIDFEDGFGRRTEEEEDRAARGTALETAAGLAAGTLPPMMGIRIKPVQADTRTRAFRTLELYLATLAEATRGALPAHFAVTLPKVVSPAEVAACAKILRRLEKSLRLTSRVTIELMIERPAALMDADGRCPVRALIAAAEGRCVATHFGPYDYTAALGITGADQHIDHPACDAARSLLQLACAGTGVRLSDGPVNILPIPPHRSAARLSARQERGNRAAMTVLWRRNFQLVRRSLQHGYYQGWDLHPAQLPIRYAAVYSFFLEHLETQAARLRSFTDQAARTSVVEGVFDDAATAQGLVNFFRQGLSCGAFTGEDLTRNGVNPDDVRTGAAPNRGAEGAYAEGTLERIRADGMP